MAKRRTRTTKAVILKRYNTGETDRIVTLLTEDEGKVAAVAKGVRKLNSSKRAYLEPGNQVKAYLITTRGLPLLTQAELIDDYPKSKEDLPRIRQLSQVLETFDRLFTMGEEDIHLFPHVIAILQLLNLGNPPYRQIQQRLDEILKQLGYAALEDSGHDSLLEYVSHITERPMRSWEFLEVQ